MSSAEALEITAERRGRGDEEDCQSRKRRRVNDGTKPASIEMSYKPRFVEFHFKMLKSLYENSNATVKIQGTCDGNAVSSDEVDENVWSKIRDFLIERPRISHSKKEATLWDNIRREAMQISESSSKSRSPVKQNLGRIGLTPLSAARYSSASPISPPKQPRSSENSFFIIAQFLGKESLVFREAYSHQKNAIKPLLSSTEHLIRRLEQDVAVLKQAIANEEQEKLHLLLNGARFQRKSSKQDNGQEDKESRLAELLTKMRLWQLLETDLKAIL